MSEEPSEQRKRFPAAQASGFDKRLNEAGVDYSKHKIICDLVTFWDIQNSTLPIELSTAELAQAGGEKPHSRATVQETMKQLEKLGFLTVTKGDGSAPSSYVFTDKFIEVIVGATSTTAEKKPQQARRQQTQLPPKDPVSSTASSASTSALTAATAAVIKARVPTWKDDLDKLLERYPYSVWGDSRKDQEEAYLAKIEEGFTFDDLWNPVDNYRLDREISVLRVGKIQTAEKTKTFSHFLNDDTWRSFRGVSKVPTAEEIAADPALIEKYAKKKPPCISSPDLIDYSTVDFQNTVADVEDDE